MSASDRHSQPVRLTPSLREKVWGKKRLAPWFPDSDQPIGEAWYLAEHDLPLLVKFLFTADRLSVQVHPADGEDGHRGKTEMWYILEAEPGAKIALGFREPLTRERLREATRTAEIERLLNWIPVRPGEAYFTPAHTVHAIGGGIVLCEIQQNSDVTYRLWDYGRPRELHVEQAAAIADVGVHPGAVVPLRTGEGREELVRGAHFVTELVRIAADQAVQVEPRACHLWICIEGLATVGTERCRPGEVWLMPENGPGAAIRGPATFLRTWTP